MKSWQKDRIKMAADVRKHILDPIALASLFMGKEIPANGIEPDLEDFSRMLNLLLLGAHSGLDMLCSFDGRLSTPLSDILEGNLDRQWSNKEETQQ